MSTLRNLTACLELSTNVTRSASALSRVIGWLGVSQIAPHEGIWLQPCSAIHTVGMRTPIDIILLDRRLNVIALHSWVYPYRFWISHRRAKSIIEMGPGFLDTASIAVGDELSLIETHKVSAN